MKNVFYVIIPAVVFLLILTNVFYGHFLFASDTEEIANKYSIYVHLRPEWNSNSKNIIFDITNSWHKEHSEHQIQINSTYNVNQLQHINGKSYVELKHGFSQCQDEWTPIPYRKVIDAIRHEIEYVQGNQLSTDYEISIYPDVSNSKYDFNSQKQKIKNGYAQFIPICSSSEKTSYDYSIKTNNEDIGFDVYFVSSEQKRDEFYQSDFVYYSQAGCSAQNMKSFSGTCKNVGKNSGLLIIVPDELNPWVTKITVNLYEKFNDS